MRKDNLYKNRAFVVAGKPTYVYSGEIHYFRISPDQWEARLEEAKKAGLNTVASYVPWMWHEYEEGKFDFTGATHPQRDVARFSALVKKAGLFFIPRIGPVANGEMLNEGLPAWLLKRYPEAFLSSKDGKTIHHQFSPAYNSPVFLAMVEKWYEKVLPLFVKDQSPDGHIILFQLCNEIGMVNWLGKIPDRNEYSNKAYQQFLRGKFDSIHSLNAAWNSHFTDFDNIPQPDNQWSGENFAPLLAWGDYYRWYYAHYYQTISAFARKRGVKTLLLANIPQFYDYDVRGRGIYSPTTTLKFGLFHEQVDDLVFGGAYQMRRLDYENFHDILVTTQIVQSITGPGLPVVCAELQTGILSDKPRLYPADVELNLKTSLMSGLNGLNCYMFSGGKNEPEMGQFGEYHEWQAPIGSDGSRRPHFESLERFGSIIKQFGPDLAESHPVYDIAIGFYEPHFRTEFLDGPLVDDLFQKRTRYFFDGSARLAWLCGFQPKILDLQKMDPGKDARQYGSTLVFSSFEFLAEDIQEKLYEFVQQGGTLVLFGDTQLRNEKFKPGNALQKLLGLETEIVPHVRTAGILGQEVFIENQPVTVFKNLENTDEIIARLYGHPCGFIRKIGSGKICFVGFHFSDRFAYFPLLFNQIMKKLGTQKVIEMDNHDIIPLLRRTDDHGFLFLGNYHDDVMASNVSFDFNGESIAIPVKMKNRSGMIVPLFYPIASDLKICYSSCEISRIRVQEKEVLVDVASESIGENFLVLAGREIVAAERKNGKLRWENTPSKTPNAPSMVRVSWDSSSFVPGDTLRIRTL